jgi:hypothetical protein
VTNWFIQPAHGTAAPDAMYPSRAKWPLQLMCMSSAPARVARDGPKGSEPHHRPHHSFDGSVVLFDDVVQIFDPTDLDVRLMFCVVAFDRRAADSLLDMPRTSARPRGHLTFKTAALELDHRAIPPDPFSSDHTPGFSAKNSLRQNQLKTLERACMGAQAQSCCAPACCPSHEPRARKVTQTPLG